jgi:tripartite-type tricarboxylate transporter receptor subunit TctC
MLDRTRQFAGAFLALALLSSGASAQTDAFPSRAVTLVAPFPAGSITDGVARMVAEHFGRTLGQSAIVENKPGQEGAIAARAVARAEPDGYTILAGGSTTHSAALALYKALPYDPLADFRSIGGVMKVPLLLCVRADFPADDLAGFLKAAKAKQGGFSFGSGSTATRAAGELLKARAGIDLLHVPYRGIPNAMTDLLGGRIDMAFIDPSNAIGQIEDGKIKALAATSGTRIKRLPNVPTIAESGFPGYEVVPWIGLFVPAKTPDAVARRLTAELRKFHTLPSAVAFVEKIGVEMFAADQAQTDAYLTGDIKSWADFVELAKIEKN